MAIAGLPASMPFLFRGALKYGQVLAETMIPWMGKKCLQRLSNGVPGAGIPGSDGS
jgi:hypothetical protein